MPEKSVFTNHVPRLRLKVRSREQNSALESRRVSLYSVKVIKISRLISIAFLFYGRFTDRFIVVKQTVKQNAQLFGPKKRKILRGDNSDVPETLAFLTSLIHSRHHI